jgi:signal transduction histidine kinase/ligand-binding sensor domain-containing protein
LLRRARISLQIVGHVIVGSIAALSLVICCSVKARPEEPKVSDVHHKAWTLDDGLGLVFGIQQAPNGFIWLTTAQGIFRFDGVRFESVDEVTNQQVHNADLDTVFASASGDLWFATRSKGLLLWRDRHLSAFPDRDCTPSMKNGGIVEDPDGTLWIQSSRGLFRLWNGHCQAVKNEPAFPTGYSRSILIDHEHTLWLKWVSGEVFFRLSGQKNFQRSVHGSGATGLYSFLKEAPDGTVWLSDDHGLRRISGRSGPVKSIYPRAENPRALMPSYNFTFAPDGSIWAASNHGLQHFRNIDTYAIDEPLDLRDAETFNVSQGLSSNTIWDLMFDHEDNLWVGTATGLDRLRHTAFSTIQLPSFEDHQFAIALGDNNSLWVGSRTVPLTHIFASGRIQAFPQTHNSIVIRRTFDGSIWSSGSGDIRLWKVANGSPTKVDFPPNDDQTAADIAVDRNRELWMTTFAPESYHLLRNEWLKLRVELGRKPGIIGAMSGDDDGDIWFAFSNKLVEWDGSTYHRYSFPDGTNNISVVVVAVHGQHVWMGGSGGVLLFSQGKFRLLRWKGQASPGSVTGVVETKTGDLWVNGPSGVAHVPADEMRRWFADPVYAVTDERFSVPDGLPGLAAERWPEPSAVESITGLLWFATTKGIAWIDPSNMDKFRNRRMPPVVIKAAISEQKTYFASHAPVLLPHHGNVEFDYTALSFSVPERVLFRYKLEGLETEWQNAGTRRQAFYTNLTPGKYAFVVVACNNDGLWNMNGDRFAFIIPPAFYQTAWFRVLVVMFVGILLWLIYLLRLAAATEKVRARMTDRLAERERIARDLHDTLLQGFQLLTLVFQAAMTHMPSEDPIRETMGRALGQADNVLVEARNSIRNLRADDATLQSLSEALTEVANQLQQGKAVEFNIGCIGEIRLLNPALREDLFRIGKEALINAHQHSGASKIDVNIDYGQGHLEMVIRDNGIGIAQDVLAGGRKGHWGLSGMRERALDIGGQLAVRTDPHSGTEILVTVPGKLAYRAGGTLSRWS